MKIAWMATLGLALAGSAMAADIYRWTDQDNRVHYTDQPPPPTAKKVEQLRLSGNAVEVDKLPYATQVAAKKNPVTLYVSACGQPCDDARAYLAKRGIPHTAKDPSASQDVYQELGKLVGKAQVPVLVIGDGVPLRGFETGAWERGLDAAGYPRSGIIARAPEPLPAPAPEPAKPPAEAQPKPAEGASTPK